jgi:hypothetical protein
MSGVMPATDATDERPFTVIVVRASRAAPTVSNTRSWALSAMYVSNDTGLNRSSSRAKSETIELTCGRGRSRTIEPRVKPTTAPLLPTPRAIVSSNSTLTPGVRAKLRNDCRRSRSARIACRGASGMPFLC